MRIKKWLGLVTDASPYAIIPGVNRAQCNIQNVIPGQLTPRGGMELIPDAVLVDNAAHGTPILSMYRYATGGSADKIIALNDAGSGNGSVSTWTGTANIEIAAAGAFTNTRPLSCCEDRFGNLYMFQGGGMSPRRSTLGSPPANIMGILPPNSAPVMTRVTSSDNYYIERVDVVDGGSGYWAAPTITVTGVTGVAPANTSTEAVLQAVVEAGTVASVNVLKPGYYQSAVMLGFGNTTQASGDVSLTANLGTATSTALFGISTTSTLIKSGTEVTPLTETYANTTTPGTIQYLSAAATTSSVAASHNPTTNVWSATLPLYGGSFAVKGSPTVTLTFANVQTSVPTIENYDIVTPTTLPAGLAAANAYAAGCFISKRIYNSLTGDSFYCRIAGIDYELAYDGVSRCFNVSGVPVTWVTAAGVAAPAGTVSGSATIKFDTTAGWLYANATDPNYDAVLGSYYRRDIWSKVSYFLPTKISQVILQSNGTGVTATPAPTVNTLNVAVYSPTPLPTQPNATAFPTLIDATGAAGTIVFTAIANPGAPVVTNYPGAYTNITAVPDSGDFVDANDTGTVTLRKRTIASNTISNGRVLTFNAVSTAASVTYLTGAVASVTVGNGGTKFLTPPEIFYKGGGGYGLELEATVAAGVITGVSVVSGGANFTSPPSVFVRVGGAQAAAVMRPIMTGTYQCAIRWADDTPSASGGPVYSSFSAIATFDAGPTASYVTTKKLKWSFPSIAPNRPLRATQIELWRTSSQQSLVFYKVGSVAANLTQAADNFDMFNDELLFSPDRAGYSAMPVVLPNGALNAYRFGVPRNDMSVCVSYQDRLWYAVSTSGEKINSVFFSEYDEFESCPDVNEITIQQNIKDPDYIQALIPFGSALLVMQANHAYSLSFISDPTLDAQVQLIGFRGCFNQNTWDIFEGTLYILDERGVYSMGMNGAMESISDQIGNVFRGANLYRSTASDPFWHLKIDPFTKVLRVWVSPVEDAGSKFPTVALCYHLTSKTWWTERWPCNITASVSLRDADGRVQPAYASTTNKVYRLDSAAKFTDEAIKTITSCTMTSGGSGYTSPPTVTAPTGFGAVLTAVLDQSGKVIRVDVAFGGTGYTTSDQLIFAPAGATGTINCGSNARTVPWLFKTGNMEFVTDRDNPKAGNFTPRSVALTYQPSQNDRVVNLNLYYNNSSYPRNNVLSRDRGTGFVQTADSPDTTLNMKSERSSLGDATGVAKALYSGRALDDMGGTDRHVALELSVPASVMDTIPKADVAIIYDVDIQGVVE